MLGYGGFLLLGGRCADVVGRRRVLVWGLVAFIVASALGTVVGDGTLLTVARFVRGASAAFTAPAALSILTTSFREGLRRNRARPLHRGGRLRVHVRPRLRWAPDGAELALHLRGRRARRARPAGRGPARRPADEVTRRPAHGRLDVAGALTVILEGRIEPGRVFDRTVDPDGVPGGYPAMNDRESIKVMVKPA